MQGQPSIYDLLAKKSLTNITSEQIHEAMARTKADTATFDFWQGVLMLQAAIKSSRTFAHGLPIHTTATVVSAALADGANVSHTPQGTEVWLLQAITENSCSFGLRDTATGNIQQLLVEGATTGTTVLNQPIYLTSSLSLFISNASGSSQTPTFAYYKVSL